MTTLKRMDKATKLERPRQVTFNAANDPDLYAFLPAAIEVEQRPSSKAGRAIIWLIVLLFVLAVLWACFGKIDIVAVAQGKVIPSEAVKQIQSLETARVEAIHVKEGQVVRKGDVLLQLDAQIASSELKGLRAELSGVEQNLDRLGLLINFLSGQSADIQERIAAIDSSSALSIDQQAIHQQDHIQQQAQLFEEQSEVLAQLTSFENERAKLLAEQAMTQAELAKKQQVTPVLKERVDALDTLQQKSYGSKLQYLELKQELIEEQQDLEVQKARLNQLQQSEQSIATQEQLYLSDKRKQTHAELSALQIQRDALVQRVKKAEQRLKHFTLTAPISGQVQELAVNTIEGVVQSAQPLMQIVPSESPLEVEAMLLNKDIGFVQEGQRVAVKVNTFNFTKYGMLEGMVSHISDDAVSNSEQGESLGLVYPMRIQLDNDTLVIEGKRIRLSPGMAVTAEVKTGQRRLIEFFLSPLLRYKQESLGER